MKKTQRKKNKNNTNEIIFIDNKNNNCNNKKNFVSVLFTILKKKKITIIIHPKTMLINHTNFTIEFYYGKINLKNPKKNIKILGKNLASNVFIINNNEKNISIKCNEIYFSDNIDIDLLGNNIIKLYNIKEPQKTIEFIMKITINLVAKDLDIYCKVIEFFPKFVIYNLLKEDVIIKCYNKEISVVNNVENNKEFLFLKSGDKNNFDFFGKSEKCRFTLTICNDDEIYNENNKNNNNNNKNLLDKWKISYPFVLADEKLITIEIMNKLKTKKRYINLEKNMNDVMSIISIKDSNTKNCKIIVENYSKKISCKMFQENYPNNITYINCLSKNIFAFTNQNDRKIIKFFFGFGDLKNRPIMNLISKKFEISDTKIKLYNNNIIKSEEYPFKHNIFINENKYLGHCLEIRFETDGLRIKIKIKDKMQNDDDKNKNFYENFKLEMKIKKLGISIIGDNRFIEKNNNYMRKELCYVSFENIQYCQINQFNDEINRLSTQLKILNFEIDNQISYINVFPITLKQIEFKEKKDFFNITFVTESNIKENIYKILSVNYLLQSFNLNLESTLINAIFNLSKNFTKGLKISFTQIHPIFLPKNNNNIFMKEDYITPKWMIEITEEKIKYLSNNVIFIENLKASPIEIMFSLLNQNKDKLNKQISYLENFQGLISLFDNIENLHIQLRGTEAYNILGEKSNIFNIIFNCYRSDFVKQVLKLVFNLEILGNPASLFKGIGSGFRDFFEKPIKGIVKGPIDGMKGVVKGTSSLFINTTKSILSSTSTITSGISKELLYFTKDDEYINNREKTKMLEKPTNFVEGLGFGLVSIAGGVYHGITDFVKKPIEGAKKNNIKGFGKGLVQGFSGLVIKPLSGVVDMVSKTSEGMKNTFENTACSKVKKRGNRVFYGALKYIKNYNKVDSEILEYLNTKIIYFKNNFYDFVDYVIFILNNKDKYMLLFSSKVVYLIDINCGEVPTKLNYSNIKDVVIESNDDYNLSDENNVYNIINRKIKVRNNKNMSKKEIKIKIYFKVAINGQKYSELIFEKIKINQFYIEKIYFNFKNCIFNNNNLTNLYNY